MMIIEQEKQISCCVYLQYDIVSVDTWLSMWDRRLQLLSAI